MINDQFKLRQFLFLTITIMLIACQEDSVKEETDLLDKDMIDANRLADEYLTSTVGRASAERSITVMKFIDGKLYFGTNTDDVHGYEEITEETITAYVEPGEYIFWYSGGGLSDLDGIVFDEESMLQLVDAPDEVNADKMWVVSIPEDFEEEDGILKYDIIYQYKGHEGAPIRLDPKIKVAHEEAD